MKYLVWIGLFLPLGLGLLISFLLQQSIYADAIFSGQYAFNLAGIISRLGMLMTVLLLGLYFGYRRFQRRLTDVRQEVMVQQTDYHQRFLQRLNHELKNPIMILKLGMINLQDEHQMDNDATLQRVEQQTQRLEKLVKDLQWLTELRADKLDKSELNISEVIDDAIASSTWNLEQRAINVDVQTVPWHVGTIMGDRDLLVMGIRNLIDNAIKFTKDNGQIHVRVKDDGNQVSIEVADNGIGIEEQDRKQVFEELYRGQNATPVNGSGLGLSLVERIIKLHDGHIHLHSRQNEGTLVTLLLNHK